MFLSHCAGRSSRGRWRHLRVCQEDRDDEDSGNMRHNIHIYVRQPAARGHRAFTDLSAARVRGQSISHGLQPCQLGNDSLLDMVSILPLYNTAVDVKEMRSCYYWCAT